MGLKIFDNQGTKVELAFNRELPRNIKGRRINENPAVIRTNRKIVNIVEPDLFVIKSGYQIRAS